MELCSKLIILVINDGVRRRADKTVIKRKSESVGGWEICKNASTLKGVAFAKCRKKAVSLSFKIVLFANCDDSIGGELFCLFIVAYDNRAFLLSFGKEAQTCLIRTANKSQGLIGGLLSVF